MPLRVVRQILLQRLSACCDPETAGAVADQLLDEGWRPPLVTITTEQDLDNIPNGTAVLIGNLNDPTKVPTVGVKATHCVLLTGEDEPYPFHHPGIAPPLPLTAIWVPGEDYPPRPLSA